MKLPWGDVANLFDSDIHRRDTLLRVYTDGVVKPQAIALCWPIWRTQVFLARTKIHISVHCQEFMWVFPEGWGTHPRDTKDMRQTLKLNQT